MVLIRFGKGIFSV